MHYFKFNIGDYASHTQHLSPMEDLAYRRLLEWYYLSEHPLNTGISGVARKIRMSEYEVEVKSVLEEFFVLVEHGWKNERADREIAEFHSKIEKASKAGKASAERRFNGRSTDVQPTNNHKPITNNHEPVLFIDPIGSKSAAKLPDCPHRQILEIWKEKLPHLAQPRTWEGARKTALRCRWLQAAKPSAYSPEGYASEAEGLRWWRSFFDYIADSKLSAGFESEGRTWQPDLEWVVNASNFQKIIDGKYDK